MIKYCLLPLLLLLLCCNLAWADDAADKRYTVTFTANFHPERSVIEARISVAQSTHLLRLMDLDAPESRYGDIVADGSFERNGKRLLWNVPATGGSLSYKFRVEHERGDFLDAHMTGQWALLRLDDVFPPARVRSRIGASSHSLLEFHGPAGWRFETRYRVTQGSIIVDAPERRFVRPTGWMAAGKLGVRRDHIAKRRVTVAAPKNQGMRRLDIIAFLRWTLPHLVKVFPQFPDRLLIVGANDEMWHGGLSGPGSLYIHPDLPLISENGTSTLLHELVHTATGTPDVPREDWIIEGLAEYYSLEILRRSSGISKKRFQQSMAQLAEWAKRKKGKLKSPSSGANTARAVLLFDQIQRELAEHDAGTLDAVARKLMASNRIDAEQLIKLVDTALGSRSDSLRQTLQQNLAARP